MLTFSSPLISLRRQRWLMGRTVWSGAHCSRR